MQQPSNAVNHDASAGMAPLRRYLRISKYSVLECRIYLDNPALAHSWLLNSRDPVLPRVIEAVRPYVLPKLREERERSRKKNTKKRGIKDTVTEGAFPWVIHSRAKRLTRFETNSLSFSLFPSARVSSPPSFPRDLRRRGLIRYPGQETPSADKHLGTKARES